MICQEHGYVPDPAEIVRYAEEHKINIDTEAGLSKVLAALSEQESKKPRPLPQLKRLRPTGPHSPEPAEMLRYAEEHNIDLSTEEGVRRVLEALGKRKVA